MGLHLFCPLKDHIRIENGAHFKVIDRLKVPQPINGTLCVRVEVFVFLIASRPP